MHLFEKRERFWARGLILTLVVFLLLVFLFSLLLSQVQHRADAQQTTLLRDTLKRAAITCYAIEGRYPPSLDYMRDHYGVVVDDSKFLVNYDAFASNLMPYISVMQRGADGL